MFVRLMMKPRTNEMIFTKANSEEVNGQSVEVTTYNRPGQVHQHIELRPEPGD